MGVGKLSSSSLRILLIMAGLGYASLAWAQTVPVNHAIEALVEVGPAWPRFWSSESTNEHVGTGVTGSLLAYFGRGWSAGVAAEWVHIPWTTRLGDHAHFDSVIVGPEGRYTFNSGGHWLPHLYAGFGWGTLSVSQVSSCEAPEGGLAARFGLGLDYRILPRLRVGLSAGAGLMMIGTQACNPQPPYVSPGIPTDPGSIWSLRVGARGEFL
jgi:hypothetical protein